MGTRFVLSEECIAHENYKQAVLKAKDRSTVVTGVATGHPVRVIANKLSREYLEKEKITLEKTGFETVFSNDILPFAKNA